MEHDLLGELQALARDEHLQATREELETSNEELKSSNEEMQSVNEELQSANEEMETSREELQSVNEELATVNAELSAKVLDLSRSNNDMNNLLSGTGIATVFLDPQLRIVRFTPAAAQIINLIPGDIGRPVSHLVSNLVGYDSLATDAQVVLDTAHATAEQGGLGAAKLVCFCSAVEDNPFVAGAHIGAGEGETVVNVGVSGPGVVRSALARLGPGADLLAVAETVKRTAFKITRMGELVGREAARRLGTSFGIVDVSLAPTPAVGDSVADILELIGVDRTGAPGTTAALALLTDAVKKGGAMASSSVGGLSGAFIPVSEDAGMIRAVAEGALSLAKLEAMTSVCSVGLDMVAVPGDTPVDVVAGIIADEMAIGMINNKTTAVRLLPIPGRKPGETVDWGGLLGTAIVQDPGRFGARVLHARGGRVPAPLQGYKN